MTHITCKLHYKVSWFLIIWCSRFLFVKMNVSVITARSSKPNYTHGFLQADSHLPFVFKMRDRKRFHEIGLREVFFLGETTLCDFFRFTYLQNKHVRLKLYFSSGILLTRLFWSFKISQQERKPCFSCLFAKVEWSLHLARKFSRIVSIKERKGEDKRYVSERHHNLAEFNGHVSQFTR